jgi:hypothetical protein
MMTINWRLHYKHHDAFWIVIDNFRVMLQIVASFTDKMLIVLAAAYFSRAPVTKK